VPRTRPDSATAQCSVTDETSRPRGRRDTIPGSPRSTGPDARGVAFTPKRAEAETVADRLTENVRERVLPARYLRTDATGEVIETFEPVAQTVARAEMECGDDPDDKPGSCFRGSGSTNAPALSSGYTSTEPYESLNTNGHNHRMSPTEITRRQ